MATKTTAESLAAQRAGQARKTVGDITVPDPVMQCRGVNVHYGDKQAIRDVNLDIANNQVIAMIGPSGCGKSTFLRCLNRLNDTIPIGALQRQHHAGRPGHLRQGTGRGAAAGAHRHGVPEAQSLSQVGLRERRLRPAYPRTGRAIVPSSTRSCRPACSRAGLWEEVKDRLDQPGTALSGGQQQRLCIARTIAVSPEVILMDEPCSALDPIATARIEDLIDELKQNYAICIVTHSMQQAARVSQRTAYFHLGDLIEVGPTDMIFTNPRHKLTEDYITGRFG